MSLHTTISSKPVQWLKAMALLVLLVLAHASALAQATVTFFHNDIAGTPLAATDSAGNLLWKETYRPYGERLTHSPPSSTNSVWFTSKPQDPHTGLVYMGARYYDPVIGRFMGTDPVGFVQGNVHSVNRYAYANNNPYRFVDPDGRQAVRNFPDRFKELLLDGGAGGGPALNDALEASGMAPVSDAALAAGIASGSGAKSLIPTFGSGAAKGPIWSSTKKLSSVENALGHWNKHKAEFPELANSKQYVEAAHSLAAKPPVGALTKPRGAETLIYDRATNTFLVRGADGAPKTMFRPTDGINYWNKQ